MSRRIRDDFEGVVHVPGVGVLKAGDEEPEGVELGDHLFGESGDESAPEGDGAGDVESAPESGSQRRAARKSTK